MILNQELSTKVTLQNLLKDTMLKRGVNKASTNIVKTSRNFVDSSMVLRSSDPLRLDRASDLVDYYSAQQAAPSSTATTGPAPANTGAADTGAQAGAAGHKQIS